LADEERRRGSNKKTRTKVKKGACFFTCIYPIMAPRPERNRRLTRQFGNNENIALGGGWQNKHGEKKEREQLSSRGIRKLKIETEKRPGE